VRDCVDLCVVMGKNMEIFGEILEMESCDSGFCSVVGGEEMRKKWRVVGRRQ
jgi:hypothetical protein